MTELLEAWPVEHLGHFMAGGYRYKPRDTRVQTQMSSGPPKSRQVTRDQIVDHYFSLSFTFEEEAYFRWWVKHRIEMGNAWCELPLHTGAGMANCPAFFVNIGDSTRFGGRYQINCQALTRTKPGEELTETQVLALLDYGALKLQSYSNALASIINEEW